MKGKRNLALTIAAIMLTSLLLIGLAACNPATTDSGGSGATAAPAPGTTDSSGSTGGDTAPGSDLPYAYDPGKNVTLEIMGWNNPGTVRALEAVNELFTAEYPSINVELNLVDTNTWPQFSGTKLTTRDWDIMMGNGTNPILDFVYLTDGSTGSDGQSWIRVLNEGHSLDITDMPFVDNWNKSAVETGMSYNGRVYMLTTGFISINGIFYNKDMFAANGWSVPNTWAEFAALCAAIREAGYSPMTGAGGDSWPVGMMMNNFIDTMEPDPMAFSRGLWERTRRWDDPGGLAIAERIAEYLSFYEEGYLGLDYASANGRFIAGLVPMIAAGSWDGIDFDRDCDFEFGYFPFPGDEAKTYPLLGRYDMSYHAAPYSANLNEVLLWMDFLSRPEVYKIYADLQGMVPTMDGVVLSDRFSQSINHLTGDLAFSYQRMHQNPEGMDWWGWQEGLWWYIATGDQTAQESAAEAADAWERAMDALDAALGR